MGVWEISNCGYDGTKNTHYGNKYFIGNGYMGVRGTLDEFRKNECTAVNLAGIYDKRGGSFREPLNAPNGLYAYFTADEKALRADAFPPLLHELRLDFKAAVLYRKSVWDIDGNRITFQSERFADRNHTNILSIKYTIQAEKNCNLCLMAGIDGDVWDLNGPHYDAVTAQMIEGLLCMCAVTHEMKHEVVVLDEISYQIKDSLEKCSQDGDLIQRFIHFEAEAGKVYEISRRLAVMTSKDGGAPISDACRLLEKLADLDYESLKKEHESSWKTAWEKSAVVIQGDEEAMSALNYSLYHLMSIAPRHTSSLSIAARGLSGQTYRGAVFWDTEMFMLDFFLLTDPGTCKTLLQYRIDTLSGAKQKAEEYGYEGAFYAWESQEGGYDACSDYNVIDVFTERPMRTYFRDKQVHISAAIVYGLIKYYETTGDSSLLECGGFEVVLECASFYQSLLLKRFHRDVYEIHDVIGPDEYHERVNNNGYTNRMAKFVIEKAAWLLEHMAVFSEEAVDRIVKKYPIHTKLEEFSALKDAIYMPVPDQEGVLEQFDGYFSLEDTTLEELKKRILHPKEYWGGANGIAAHTKIIKQADVITWLCMFPKDYPEDVLRANWDYYEGRTEHGSSLSACMYALTACRLLRQEAAYPFFMKSASADLQEGGKEWAGLLYIGGTHPAASGGAYMSAVFGFAGLTLQNGTISGIPHLPEKWESIAFHITYLGKEYAVRADKKGLTYVLVENGEIA